MKGLSQLVQREDIAPIFCFLFILSLVLAPALAIAEKTTLSAYSKPAVRQFTRKMAKDYHFDQKKLATLFKQVQITEWKPSPHTNQKTKTSGTAEQVLPWWQYRQLFLTEARINEGVAFWRKYRTLLSQVEKEFQVPASIIVATLGIETHYGHRQGQYNALNTLTSLAFTGDRRSTFFKEELIHFLLLTRQNQLDPLQIKSSYAGALGWAQFMPSSYNKYAVDYSKTGKANLFEDVKDVVASIAHYYQSFGWKAHQPVVRRALVTGNQHKQLFLQKSLRPTLRFSQLKALGVHLRTPIKINPSEKALFFKLQGKNEPLYYLGFNNFHVITRYNPDKKYAMAIFELSQALSNQFHTIQRHEKELKKHSRTSSKG